MPDSLNNRREMPMQSRLMPVSSVDDKSRTVKVTWTTGARVQRYDWMRDRSFLEELSLDPAHVRMSRFQAGSSPFLNSHGQYSVSDVLGVVERAQLTPTPEASIRFSSRPEVEPIFRDVKDGILRNISVGYRVYRYEMSPPPPDSQDGAWIYRAVDWEPMELSLVPIPADPGAQVRAQGGTHACEFELAKDALDAHRSQEKLQQDIFERCATAQLPSEFARDLIRQGLDFNQACARIVDRVAEKQIPTPFGIKDDRMDDYNNPDVKIRGMAEMLTARLIGTKPGEFARQWHRASIVDMAQQILEMRGVRTSMMSKAEILGRSMHATSDLPGLLADTGSRILRAGYDSYTGGLKKICRQITAPDFRAINKLQFGETPPMLQVIEGGEFKSGKLLESKANYNLNTYGRIVGISRQALINDDLSAFSQLTQRMGRGAAEFESSQLAALLTSNPTLADGLAVFHSTHGNKAASQGAISTTTLGAAKSAMRLQKGLDGTTPIDATPRYLVVPAALEVVALQNVAQITPAQTDKVNPFTNQLEVVVDPRLDAYSAVGWYLAADPGTIDTIEYAYLEGAAGPQFEVQPGFDVDGVRTKIRLDFGCSIFEYRGLYANF